MPPRKASRLPHHWPGRSTNLLWSKVHQDASHLSLHQVDVNSAFYNIIADPGAYALNNVSDPAYLDPNHKGQGYLFWDTVHPTTEIQALIGVAAFATVPQSSSSMLVLTGGSILGDDHSASRIFNRDGEFIQVAGGSEQIRIPRSTPALAALFSLLAIDHPYRLHVDRLSSFFSGMRYYSLDDRTNGTSLSETPYSAWVYVKTRESESKVHTTEQEFIKPKPPVLWLDIIVNIFLLFSES
jgi:hypothetical protein